MLRFLLKMALLAWVGFLILLLAMLTIGKTAPDSIKIALFSQDIEATSYWHLDLYTGIAFKDSYSPRLLVNSIDSVAFNPVSHFLTLESTATDVAVYELDLSSRERRYIASYPVNNHYIVLEGDFLFIVEFAGGTYDWTRIDIPSRRSELFLEDTELSNLSLSHDESWLSGINRNQLLFINMIDSSSYTLSGYCCILWSPDSQWYIAAHENSAGLISVLNARGEAHPLLPKSFSAPEPFWSSDSQSIFFVRDNHLASISLQTGEIREYPTKAQGFQTNCLAPNERYLIIYDAIGLTLIDIETGAEISRFNHSSGHVRICLWSEDSRYLLSYIATPAPNSLATAAHHWQTFVVFDTLRGNYWSLYPENLLVMPFYIYFPD
jgi:WD40 repeat protein